MLHLRPVTFLLCLGLLLAGQIQAQRHSFKHYGPEQGLRTVALNSLTQDTEGYIWVGTQSGLYRYDGSRFQLIGDLETFLSMDVQAVAAAPDGSVWAGTRKGLVVVEGTRARAVPVAHPVEVTGATSLAVDERGVAYVASAAGLHSLKLGPGGKVTHRSITN